VSFRADLSDVAKQFPGIPLQTLKQRYRNKKAKLMEWSAEEVHGHLASNLGRTAYQVRQRI
jgi:hypothetical protein